MRYKDIECPSCGQPFTDEADVVVCPVCGTPEHRDCWQKDNACANHALHESGFTWSAPAIETPPPGGNIAGSPNFTPSENTEVCKRCSAIKEVSSPCSVCGFDGNANASFESTFNHSQNDFGATGSAIPPSETIDGIPVYEVAQYVRQNTHSYIPHFVKMDKSGKKASWNWAAFLFPFFWFFYRKMYLTGGILMAIHVLLDSVMSFFFSGDIENYTNSMNQLLTQLQNGAVSPEQVRELLPAIPAGIAVIFIIYFAVSIFTGLYGTYLYKKDTVKNILKIREQATDMPSYNYLLILKGGISFAAALAAYLFYLFARI